MIKKYFLFLIFMSVVIMSKGSQPPGSPERGTLKKSAVKLIISTNQGQAQQKTDTHNKPMQINMTRRIKMVHRRDDGAGCCKMLCCFTVGCCCGCILK